MTTAAHDTRACALPGTPLDMASRGLDACVHCGFCLQACPTYVNLEDENDSPRGRLVLMRRMLEGDIAIDDPHAGMHLDRCLGCRACETACPSGVPYGELLEATRATMKPARGLPLVARLILAVFARPVLLHAAMAGARVARATGIASVAARVLPRRMAFPFAMLASTKPVRPGARSERRTATRPQDGNGTPAEPTTVALLEGCVMRGLFSHVNAATQRCAERTGCTVVQAAGQGCCGALHAHAGDLEGARALARTNIAAFEHSGAEFIVTNSAGCGAMMKGYSHLLHDDAEFAQRAEWVAARTRDASEFLAPRFVDNGIAPAMEALPLRVTHDAPCHQMHAQRIVRQPLALLESIPEIELVPLEDSDQCCGSAGIYNLVEPDTSDAVLAPKLANIRATRADFVATGNPGCLMQIGAGLLLDRETRAIKAVHPLQLVDASLK